MCKRNKEIRRPLSRSKRKKKKKQAQKGGKTSKLIAYISTRMCKIYQYDVQCYIKVR